MARLHENFWLLPMLIVLACGGLAALLTSLDVSSADSAGLAFWPLMAGAGPEGAREVMATIAGSMMTVLGVTFSMILVVLSLASSQYTSRILRNFIRDRVTQVMLGIFSGIFTYCIIVLRAIRGGENESVPDLAIMFGFILALAGVGVFIYFLHHIAESIEAANIVASIARETEAVIHRLYPERAGEEPAVDYREPAAGNDRPWQAVPARHSGYIQTVNTDALLHLASKWDTIIRLENPIGDFIIEGAPLASIAMAEKPDNLLIRHLQAEITISPHRTIEQDAAFGVRQIVDVALKALSPAISDTTTAITCMDYLTVILTRLAARDIPSPNRHMNGQLRLIARGIDFPDLLGKAFNQIRELAEGNSVILLRMVSSLQTLAGVSGQPACRLAIGEQARWTGEQAERTLEAAHDRAMIKQKLAQLFSDLKSVT